MKYVKEAIKQLTRIANSLMMIEMTLLEVNKLKYTDIVTYSESYNENAEEVANRLTKYDKEDPQ